MKCLMNMEFDVFRSFLLTNSPEALYVCSRNPEVSAAVMYARHQQNNMGREYTTCVRQHSLDIWDVSLFFVSAELKDMPARAPCLLPHSAHSACVGCIPKELRQLTNLQKLVLGRNQLTGNVIMCTLQIFSNRKTARECVSVRVN